MYAESKTAIYDTLKASLLFWGGISKSLEKMGYQRNKYYWCVMYKIFKGKQFTILWHVDDLNMSHVDSHIVSSVLVDINTVYGNIKKMTTTRGKIHKYLGMTIDYYSLVKLKLSIVDYIVMILNYIPENMRGGSSTLATYHIFDITEDSTKLPQTYSDLLYHSVAQLFYP